MRRKKDRRRISTALALAVLGLACLGIFSCSSDEYMKVRLDIPGRPVVDLAAYDEFILTNFLVRDNVKDFDITGELRDYFSEELETGLEKPVELLETFTPSEDTLKPDASWAELSDPSKKGIIITGAVSYSQEVRKALLSQDKRKFEDPFPNETKLAQRNFFSLSLDVHMIDARTGKTLYKRTFKETKADKNPNQTAPFAFFQLIQRVKEKLFDELLGQTRLQERYLIHK